MIKCFYTGIELNGDEAYVLDIGEARRMIREMKNKANAIEKLIVELGETDTVEINSSNGKIIKQRRRRLISRQLAEAFLNSYGGKNIFVRWNEWIARTRKKK